MLDEQDKGRSVEDFVNRLAFQSFVKYWCFPEPTDIIRDNKEICDILGLFDNICMILSVKNYDFKGIINGISERPFTRQSSRSAALKENCSGTNRC